VHDRLSRLRNGKLQINLNLPTAFRPSETVFQLRARKCASNVLSTLRDVGPILKIYAKGCFVRKNIFGIGE
jgi:hypothetical protein